MSETVTPLTTFEEIRPSNGAYLSRLTACILSNQPNVNFAGKPTPVGAGLRALRSVKGEDQPQAVLAEAIGATFDRINRKESEHIAKVVLPSELISLTQKLGWEICSLVSNIPEPENQK